MRRGVVVAMAGLLLAACQQQPKPQEERRPQQAGKPLNTLETAQRMAAMRAAAVTGNQAAVQANMHALTEDMRKSMRLADVTRRVDPELARAAAARIEGVRSAVWIDHENLFALVDDARARSQRTIDRICVALEPLGDTLGVVVNLQNATARNGDELEILSRNCQLPPGQRALLQTQRQVDVLSPEMRARHRAGQLDDERLKRELEKQREAMRVIEATTPKL